MKNNSHLSETKQQRLERFNKNGPFEVVATITNSIANNFINELSTVFINPHKPQTSLMFLGTHSIALTIAHGFWGLGGEHGYQQFLENFIDGDTQDTKFSIVADRIHEWRNVIAHRWINVAGHSFGYDFTMSEGWKEKDEFLMVNPKIYLDHYLQAFGPGGKIYEYKLILTTDQMWEDAKQRFISKYVGEA